MQKVGELQEVQEVREVQEVLHPDFDTKQVVALGVIGFVFQPTYRVVF